MHSLRSIFVRLLVVLTLTVSLSLNASAQSISSLHLTMGNPSGAVASTSYPTNYLMQKPQFSMSYHRDKGIPNWVAWHLGYQDLGSAPRQDNFRADTALPSGWYRVQSTD